MVQNTTSVAMLLTSEGDPIRSNVFLPLTLLALTLVALIWMRPLLPIDETRYLDVAWEMHLTSDLFHLSRNFDLYTHKPPLLFWLINLIWQATGVAEFPARLVAPAIGLVSAATLAGLARRFWPEDVGIGTRAVLVLGSFTVFLIYSSATMFDTMLLLATIIGLGLLWRIGDGEDRATLWAGFGLVLGLGVLAKGPVIFVHLLPALVTLRFWARRAPPLGRVLRGLALSLVVGGGVVSLWLGPALLAGDAAYREELLWTQSAARVAGGLAHDRPIWFLIALLPVILFPWGWSLQLWSRTSQIVRADGAARLAAISAVSGLVLFSAISGKQVHYLLPEFAAVALLVARATGSAGQRGRLRSLALLLPAVIGLAALAVAAGFVPAKGDLAVLGPSWGIALFGALCLGIAALSLRLPSMMGQVVLGGGLAIALHVLIVTTGLFDLYDARPIVARLKANEAQGIAVSSMPYNAEFNFAARLETAIATPVEPAALKAWASAHPDGMILGPVGRVPVSVPPTDTAAYNRITYGFWSGRDVAANVLE